MFFFLGSILQWNTLELCNLHTWEGKEVAFIRQRIGEPSKWQPFDEISKDTISKIKYTALFQKLMKLCWNLLHLSIVVQNYNNWMILARLGDKKHTRWQNVAEIVFLWGVSEIKCFIFTELNDNLYENYNNYIKSSIVFLLMVIFCRK